MKEAGLATQTGTVATERVWSLLKEMLPPGGRSLSLRWFRLLMGLAFLRFNFRLLNSNAMPVFAERDSLIAQRVEAISVCLRDMASKTGETAHLDAMFTPFRWDSS